MARISKYAQDDNVTRGDKFFGSDGSGKTRNFSVASVTDFISETNSAGIPLQFNWKLNQTQSLQTGEAKITASSGTTFANVTKINVSKFQFKGSLDISPALVALNNKKIIIIEVGNPNSYGTFTAGPWTDANSDGFYESSLTAATTNGSFTDGKVYAVAAFNTDGDANAVVPFDSTGTATKTINHNLGKFPNVTIKLNDNSVVYADVSHTNNNTLTITFNNNSYTGVVILN
tara:strand:- start:199 stop:891 length:693 start_codon:yes stop_codon:yes gene_type:complete